MKKPSIPPAIALFVLAPAIGELLSGSSPPLEFFNPIVFLLLATLYGSGAIVMREIKIRWKKDFRGLLLLGGAYGILEEGLMIKSFFDPQWMDLGILGVFGRWAGVNWVWTEMLIIFHAAFSITIPIVLIELAYPERKNESWISNRSLGCLMAVLGTVTVIGVFLLTPFVPPLTHYLLAILALGLFVLAAYKLDFRVMENSKKGKTRRLFIAGLLSDTAFFLLIWVGPYVIDSPVAVMLLGLLLVFGMAKLLDAYDWESPGSAVNRLAIVAGALSFMIFLAFMQETRAAGMAFVGSAAVVGILLLRRKVKKAYIPPCV